MESTVYSTLKCPLFKFKTELKCRSFSSSWNRRNRSHFVWPKKMASLFWSSATNHRAPSSIEILCLATSSPWHFNTNQLWSGLIGFQGVTGDMQIHSRDVWWRVWREESTACNLFLCKVSLSLSLSEGELLSLSVHIYHSLGALCCSEWKAFHWKSHLWRKCNSCNEEVTVTVWIPGG